LPIICFFFQSDMFFLVPLHVLSRISFLSPLSPLSRFFVFACLIWKMCSVCVSRLAGHRHCLMACLHGEEEGRMFCLLCYC
jgi:hypothetical protein